MCDVRCAHITHHTTFLRDVWCVMCEVRCELSPKLASEVLWRNLVFWNSKANPKPFFIFFPWRNIQNLFSKMGGLWEPSKGGLGKTKAVSASFFCCMQVLTQAWGLECRRANTFCPCTSHITSHKKKSCVLCAHNTTFFFVWCVIRVRAARTRITHEAPRSKRVKWDETMKCPKTNVEGLGVLC